MLLKYNHKQLRYNIVKIHILKKLLVNIKLLKIYIRRHKTFIQQVWSYLSLLMTYWLIYLLIFGTFYYNMWFNNCFKDILQSSAILSPKRPTWSLLWSKWKILRWNKGMTYNLSIHNYNLDILPINYEVSAPE